MAAVGTARSAVAAAVSMGIGDLACQQLLVGSSSHADSLDARRAAIFSVTGLICSGPAGHAVFTLLETLVPGSSAGAALRKVLLDTVIAPARIAMTFGTHQLLSGNGIDGAAAKVREDTLPTFAAGVCIFPWIIFGVYRKVPLGWRATVMAPVGALWNIYLSWAAHSGANTGHAPPHHQIQRRLTERTS